MKIKKVLLEKDYILKENRHVWITFWLAILCFFYLHECEIIPGYTSDHSGVLLKPQINFDNDKGHGYWKFNNTLLKEVEYVKKIINIIKDNLERYSLVNNNNNGINGNNNQSSEKREFLINDQLLLETILLTIRGWKYQIQFI